MQVREIWKIWKTIRISLTGPGKSFFLLSKKKNIKIREKLIPTDIKNDKKV